MIRRGVRFVRTINRLSIRSLGFFDEASRDWDKAWNMKLTPWDLKGTVAPPLVQALESGVIPGPKTKHALVPGCGTGYECLYLAEIGFESVVGLDLSPKAIQNAIDNLNAKKSSTDVAEDSKSKLNNVHFVADSFFDIQNPTVLKHKYDLIFDYLFFSALDPPARKLWASAMSRVIVPKSGILVTLVFPVNTGAQNPLEGPPYPVTVQDYKDALEPLGFEIHFTEKVCHQRMHSVKSLTIFVVECEVNQAEDGTGVTSVLEESYIVISKRCSKICFG